MELYDGASYRINIEGMDSTLIVDSFRGIIKANIVDVDDYIIVDYENKTFHGNFVGNVIDDLGNVVLNTTHNKYSTVMFLEILLMILEIWLSTRMKNYSMVMLLET